MVQLDFVVWQFVRIMVEAERIAEGGRRPPKILSAWRDVWTALDKRLTRLGKSDAAAFADLMMDQNVVIDDVSKEQVAEVMRTLESVTKRMRQEIRSAAGDAEQLASLRFETEELKTLRKRLTEIATAKADLAPPRPRPRGRQQPQRRKRR